MYRDSVHVRDNQHTCVLLHMLNIVQCYTGHDDRKTFVDSILCHPTGLSIVLCSLSEQCSETRDGIGHRNDLQRFNNCLKIRVERRFEWAFETIHGGRFIIFSGITYTHCFVKMSVLGSSLKRKHGGDAMETDQRPSNRQAIEPTSHQPTAITHNTTSNTLALQRLQINPFQMENMHLRAQLNSIEATTTARLAIVDETNKQLRQKINRLEIANRNLSHPSNDSQARIIYALRLQLEATRLSPNHQMVLIHNLQQNNDKLKEELEFMRMYELTTSMEEFRKLRDIREAVIALNLKDAVEAHIMQMHMS